MKKILFVNACVRLESRTLVLARHVLSKLNGEIEEVNLNQEDILPLNRERVQSRDAGYKEGDFSSPLFHHAHQFAEADEIVIAAPYWDLMFPALLKIYLEAVTVLGVTFRYTPEGQPEGLCRAQRLIYITTAGGPTENADFGLDYIHALAEAFYGIPEIICYKAENLDVWGNDAQSILNETLEEIDHTLRP